jgi:ATP-dependent protease HslVU (ClpYQ) peptidase subunit
MTCIAGLIDNGKVYIGGDSAGVSPSTYGLTVRADSKVFKKGEFIFGFTSSFRMGQLLRYKLHTPYHRPEMPVDEYMNTEFVDAIRTCLKEGGYAQVDKGEESGGVFLVGYRGRLFKIDSDYQVAEGVDNMAACGCGEAIALGSLFSTANFEMAPEMRVKNALTAAERFSAGVRGPFIVEEI